LSSRHAHTQGPSPKKGRSATCLCLVSTSAGRLNNRISQLGITPLVQRVYAGRLSIRNIPIFCPISRCTIKLRLGAGVFSTTPPYDVYGIAAQSYGWAPDYSAQSVKGRVFDGARSLVWVYGWAPALLRVTDTTTTAHNQQGEQKGDIALCLGETERAITLCLHVKALFPLFQPGRLCAGLGSSR
jgi:hypothetical protein